jgi:exopolysaccharide biosynthesis polyprenyl glycosylphosphotransferase
VSTLETQQASSGSLAVPRSEELSGLRARRSASWWRISLATDLVALVFALVVAHLAPGPTAMPFGWSVVFVGLVIAFLWSKQMYWPPIELRVLDATRAIVTAATVAAAMTIAIRALLTDAPAVAEETIEPWLLATAFLVAGRISLIAAERRARRRGEGQRTLIVGAGNVGRVIAQRLTALPEVGLRPVGFLDQEPLHGGEATGLPVFGAGWDLDSIVRDQQIEHVVVTFSTAPEEAHLRLLKRCDELGIPNSLVPRLFEKSTEHVTVIPLGGLPLVARHSPNPKSWAFSLKHGLDRAGAALALVVLSPLMGALALGVWTTLGRPIFYRAERVGRDGKRFDMLKFRTMLPMTEEERTNLVIDPDTGTGGVSFNGLDRRTQLGAFMRRASLDELPQLFNVLKGEMSLVGPRPERTEYVEVYEKEVHRYDERHRVKSGITGWAQVHGLRGTTSLADRAECDNYYIENWSLWLDLKIMLLTLTAVVHSANDE